MKHRLSVCFNCTVKAPDGSTDAVSLVQAKESVERALECLDGVESNDCQIQGVNNITIEKMEI